MKIIKTLIRRL